MFGESDSESPRVPSPWDSLASKYNVTQTPPKLVPEVEEGNVEYKLQLLSPTPARFTRLVTQLKWRLLEGGGQAYYELGVADSGTLVGLPRQQLEESLETLEMMACEIGASIIVVKEIEVPPELSTLAETQLERWDGRKSTRRKDLLRMMKQDAPTNTSTTEYETELSNTDSTDAEESTPYSPDSSTTLSEEETISAQFSPSPILLPFDPALAMFTMDVGEDVAGYADNEAVDDVVPTEYTTELSVGLEIASVYKPRPMKKRATRIASPPSTHLEYAKKKLKNGYSTKFADTTCYIGDSLVQDTLETSTQRKEAKAKFRRDKLGKRRELEPNGLPGHVPTCRSTESPTNSVDHHTMSPCSIGEPNICALESLHIAAVNPLTSDCPETVAIPSTEPRLIVEVLVVRELSLDEAFLDFEGFSLH